MMLKPTSFAILGQLAFRPWAAYELIKEMQRNFHYFFPKAESSLYEELKKLEKMGYAKSKTAIKGKKERTVYSITKKGKDALKEWLSSEPEAFSLEFEGLLRVFMSKFGSETDLANTLKKAENDANTLFELAEKVGNEYLNGQAPAQSEIIQRAYIFDFLSHYAVLYLDWLARMEEYRNKTASLPENEKTEWAKEHFRKVMAKLGMGVD